MYPYDLLYWFGVSSTRAFSPVPLFGTPWTVVRQAPLSRSPGGGHGNPLQYSCLENSMDRAWWVTRHRVVKTQTYADDTTLMAESEEGTKKPLDESERGEWKNHAKSWLIGKDSDAGRDWGQEEKGMTEDEMAGWHHRLNGREFGVNSGSRWWPGRPGVLQFMGSQRVGHEWVTELNWTELKEYSLHTNIFQS